MSAEAPTVKPFKLPKDKPCPRCYAPMVPDPAAKDGWSCATHGAPGSNGPVEAPPLEKANGAPPNEREAVVAEIKRLSVDGKPPSSKTNRVLKRRALKAFPTWNEAVAAAGLTPNWSRTKKTAKPAKKKEPVIVKVLTGQPPLVPAEQASVREPDPEPPPREPDFTDLASELEAAYVEYMDASDRLERASAPFLKHPVFQHLWEIYWDGLWDDKEQTYTKAGPLHHLRVATKLLEGKGKPE